MEKVKFFLKFFFCPIPDGIQYETETLNVPFNNKLGFREVQSHCPTPKPAEYINVYVCVCMCKCMCIQHLDS